MSSSATLEMPDVSRNYFFGGRMMILREFDQVSKDDLESLIENKVLEGKKLEYKQSLNLNNDSEKKEFLADISSFANASGGDIIYGISEENGEPSCLNGLDIMNEDEELRKIDSIIRDGIEPRLPSFLIRLIEISGTKKVLIIRIFKSWISPHRVIFKGHDKFYSRSSNGKFALDVLELRVAFTLSETISERIRKFRDTRISALNNNETPILFCDTPKIILHLIPFTSFNPGYFINLEKSIDLGISPMYSSGWSNRFNFDGFLVYSVGRDEKAYSYVQLYKNGIIEAVDGMLLNPNCNGENLIHSVAYEDVLIKAVQQYLNVLTTLNVDLPVLLFLTLLGVKGYKIAVNHSKIWSFDKQEIDRDILFIPEVVVEYYDAKPEEILKPCFDSIWNACGYVKSLNYNEQGKWIGN